MARKSKFGSRLTRKAKKYKIRLTVERRGKRVYKTHSALKKEISRKEKGRRARFGVNYLTKMINPSLLRHGEQEPLISFNPQIGKTYSLWDRGAGIMQDFSATPGHDGWRRILVGKLIELNPVNTDGGERLVPVFNPMEWLEGPWPGLIQLRRQTPHMMQYYPPGTPRAYVSQFYWHTIHHDVLGKPPPPRTSVPSLQTLAKRQLSTDDIKRFREFAFGRRKVHFGSRGGRYVIKNGRKKYL